MPSPSFSFLIYKYHLTSSRRATEYKCNFVRSTNYSKILLKYISHGAHINEITSVWNFFYLVRDTTTLKRILLYGKDKKEIGMMVILFPEGHIFNTVFLKDSVLWTFGLPLKSIYSNISLTKAKWSRHFHRILFSKLSPAILLLTHLPISTPAYNAEFRQYLILAKKL